MEKKIVLGSELKEGDFIVDVDPDTTNPIRLDLVRIVYIGYDDKLRAKGLDGWGGSIFPKQKYVRLQCSERKISFEDFCRMLQKTFIGTSCMDNCQSCEMAKIFSTCLMNLCLTSSTDRRKIDAIYHIDVLFNTTMNMIERRKE